MDWSRCDEIEYDTQYENSRNIIQTDNPNYFDVERELTSPNINNNSNNGNRSSGIFTFRKRLSSSHHNKTTSPPATIGKYSNIEGKLRGSLKNLWRTRSNSASINYPKECSSFKSCKNVQTMPSTSSNCREGDDVVDDVFYDKSSERKFSSSSSNEGSAHARRHSVGTFGGRNNNNNDRFCTTSFIDKAPLEFAPKAPTDWRRTSRDHPTISAAMCASIDDILIVTARQSELGILWVNYLKACFDKITKQRGKIPFNFLHIKIDDDKLDSDLIQRCQTTKLQIVIICPLLIALEHGYIKKKLSHIIKPERTIGLLLDVKEIQMSEIHRELVPSYNKWRKCVVRDNDNSFVSGLLGIAQDILGRALRQRPMASELASPISPTFKPSSGHHHNHTTIFAAGKNHENFTVIPKKMRVGQNKATVMLTDPILKDDYVKIRIEKIGHTIEIANVKRRNPYTLHFNVPESCMEISMMISIRLFKNNVDMGTRPIKCESKMRELEQILKNVDAPMEFMCQALGLSICDNDKLDIQIVHSFQKNIPPNFHLISSMNDDSLQLHKDVCPEEFPTLLHFAARWGLERMSLFLLECPGAELACEMKNNSAKTPGDIAELHGHSKLATSLRNFSKMNEFSTIYHYFKEFSKTDDNKNIIDLKTADEVGAQLPPTEECTNDSYPTPMHYLEMKSSGGNDSNNNEIMRETTTMKAKAISNLSYLNVDVSLDTVDSGGKSFEMQVMKKRDGNDLLNNLNDMKIKDEDEKEITNELTITEENYYDSQDQNDVKVETATGTIITTTTTTNKNDDFSHNCLDVLENVSQTETSSLSPSVISSSISDNQQQHSIESDYLTQPSNRPVTNAHDFADYLTQPSNRPLEELTHDYMNTSATTSSSSRYNSPTLSVKRETSHLRLYFKKKSSVTSIDEDGPGYSKIHDYNNASPTTKSLKSVNGTLKRTDSDVSKRSVDDELLEIINDFKNNVFTIQEVEELVASWKNRNDVKKSHMDKQDQLQRMREEYERIQHNLKENLKRPSPFERMKRLFSRKHSRDAMASAMSPVNLTGDPNFNPNRPESILSLASSHSSGRMSTSSSLGDSGTHSDHEERERRILNSSRVFDNYLIPPAPRPISTPISTPTELSFPSSSQNTTPVDLDHYILFPSNVPIFPPPPTMSTFKGSS